jgi:type II secretory pathway component GspD/PulD (secretin)
MNERMKKMMVLGVLILAAGICHGGAQSDGGAGRITGEATAVGRDDPFVGSFGGAGAEPKPVISVSGEEIKSKPSLFVHTVTLKFLNAANLKNALAKMSSEYGSIGVDENTNSLIICDSEENLEKIVAEVKKADQTPVQMMIEVVIVDVQLKNDTEIGVDWDLLSTANYSFGYRQSMVYPNRLTAIAANEDTIGDTTAYMTTGGLGGEVSIVSSTVRNVVHLLQEKRNVEILASPRVMVVSGQKAEIKTVEEIPYQEKTDTSGGGQLTSTQFKEVGVTLEVKATVTDDGKILLVVKPTQSVSTGTSINSVPVIDTREASTTLLMDDGQVVVMGGLRRQDTQTIKYRVPLLGDLPLIGFIFSDDRKVAESSELLVLLSPHVYKGEPVPAGAMARYNQIKDKTLISPPGESELQPSEQTKK